jgi:hypothetical protein
MWLMFFGLLWRDAGGYTDDSGKYHRATISLATAWDVAQIGRK